MNRTKLLSIVQDKVMKDYPEFKKIEPIQETVSTSISKISKKLGIESKKNSKKIYAFIYKKIKPIRLVLRIVINEDGKIIKITHSK